MLRLTSSKWRRGRGATCEGWEVDQAARAVLLRSGFGDFTSFIARGTALVKMCMATALHLDDYETHDDRRLLPGTGFTIEPGLYFDTFGVRTEINMFRGERDARVTGTRQMEIMSL